MGKMKGKINENGSLEIERAGKFRAMQCMRAVTDCRRDPCGDECPLFGEPCPEMVYYDEDCNKLEDETPSGRIFIVICENRILFFDEFEDERGV